MHAQAPPEKILKVLLVDDEEGFLSVLRKRMGKRRVEAVVTPTGSEAIGILRARDFDAAVVDLKMEDMEGIEVLRIFKKMVPDMPVLILTGHGSRQAAREGLALGAYDYLTKPCDVNELLEKLREAVAAKAARPASE